MNIIAAWNIADDGEKIEFNGKEGLVWTLTKRPNLRLIKIVWDLGIGEAAFLSDKWEILR